MHQTVCSLHIQLDCDRLDTESRTCNGSLSEIGVIVSLFVNMSAVRRMQETAALFVLLCRLALTTATAGESDYVQLFC